MTLTHACPVAEHVNLSGTIDQTAQGCDDADVVLVMDPEYGIFESGVRKDGCLDGKRSAKGIFFSVPDVG